MHFSPQPKKFTRSFCFDGCGECTFILIGWTSPVREIVVFILSFPAQLVEVFVCFLPLCEFSAHCVFVIFLLALFGSMGNSCVKLAWVHPLDFCIQTLDANFKVYFLLEPLFQFVQTCNGSPASDIRRFCCVIPSLCFLIVTLT